MFPRYFRKLVKLYHLIRYLLSFRFQGEKKSCYKIIFEERIQSKDIKFTNMKEVILKTGMQSSFSQIINNVGRLI